MPDNPLPDSRAAGCGRHRAYPSRCRGSADESFPGATALAIAATAVAPATAASDVSPLWAAAKIQMAKSYSLPNGRRYALLQVMP